MSTVSPAATSAGSNRKRLVLLTWILVAFFYFYLSYDYIRASMNDRAFGEYLQYVVQIAGTDNRPAKEIRSLILVKAEELGVPVRGDEISVLGGGESLQVRLGYEVDIEIPLFERTVYTKEFQHTIRYQRGN
jgi:hypothetical protein